MIVNRTLNKVISSSKELQDTLLDLTTDTVAPGNLAKNETAHDNEGDKITGRFLTEDAEAWAVGTRNGVPVTEGDVTYHNNSHWYSQVSEAASVVSGSCMRIAGNYADAAESAMNSAGEYSDDANNSAVISGSCMRIAGESAEDAEAWAVGKRNGVDVPSTDPTYQNSSKYWANYARQHAAGGHTILNESGTEMPQRSKLQFEGAIVSDDETNDATVVETVNPVEYEEDIYGVETPNPQSIQNQITDQTNVLGAKNLIPYPYFYTTMTTHGITITDNGDGTITVNGKATAEVDFRLQISDSKLLKLTPGEKYVLSAVSEQKNRFIAYLQYVLNRKWKYIGAPEKASLTFVMPEYDAGTYQGLFIRIFEGEEFVNSTIKPMLRLASDPDNTYVPYAMTNRELTEVTTETLTISDSTVTGSFTVSKVGKVVTITAWSVQGTTVKQGATISASIPLPANYVATPLICANSQGAIGGFLYIDNNNRLNLHVYIANTKMYGVLTYVCK